MKKICMTALLAMAALTGATAQDEKPTVSFKIPVAESKTKSFAVALRPGAAPAKIRIDWGDGNIVESDVEIAVYDIYGVPTSLQGKPVGTGVVRLFGPDIASLDITLNAKLDEEKVTEIDVTNAPELIDLTAASNDIAAVDFSRNPRLERVSLTNNKLTQADFSANPDIVRIELINNSVSSIALPDEPKVEYLQLNGNPLGRLDISGMPKLKSLYAVGCGLTEFVSGDNTELKTLSLSKNSLTALDITRLTGLGLSNKGSLSATDNKLTELKWSEFPRIVNIDRNCFALDRLPVPENTPYRYTSDGACRRAAAHVVHRGGHGRRARRTGRGHRLHHRQRRDNLQPGVRQRGGAHVYPGVPGHGGRPGCHHPVWRCRGHSHLQAGCSGRHAP